MTPSFKPILCKATIYFHASTLTANCPAAHPDGFLGQTKLSPGSIKVIVYKSCGKLSSLVRFETWPSFLALYNSDKISKIQNYHLFIVCQKVSSCEFKDNFLIFSCLHNSDFDVETIEVSWVIIGWLIFETKWFKFWLENWI